MVSTSFSQTEFEGHIAWQDLDLFRSELASKILDIPLEDVLETQFRGDSIVDKLEKIIENVEEGVTENDSFSALADEIYVRVKGDNENRRLPLSNDVTLIISHIFLSNEFNLRKSEWEQTKEAKLKAFIDEMADFHELTPKVVSYCLTGQFIHGQRKLSESSALVSTLFDKFVQATS